MLSMICWFVVGNNPANDNTNVLNKNNLKTLMDITGDNSSSHNCYGLGQKQCTNDGYRHKDLFMQPEKTIYELTHPANKGGQ